MIEKVISPYYHGFYHIIYGSKTQGRDNKTEHSRRKCLEHITNLSVHTIFSSLILYSNIDIYIAHESTILWSYKLGSIDKLLHFFKKRLKNFEDNSISNNKIYVK